MKLTEACYCDFVVWSSEEFVVLQIDLADDFIAQALEKATALFKFEILPELVGKWYTKAPLYRHVSMTTEDDYFPVASAVSSCRDACCYLGNLRSLVLWANQEVQAVAEKDIQVRKTKKQGAYNRYSPRDCADIGRYATAASQMSRYT